MGCPPCRGVVDLRYHMGCPPYRGVVDLRCHMGCPPFRGVVDLRCHMGFPPYKRSTINDLGGWRKYRKRICFFLAEASLIFFSSGRPLKNLKGSREEKNFVRYFLCPPPRSLMVDLLACLVYPKCRT